MKAASALYRLLGDEARLRLLRVLARERLNVTELTGVLGLAQSGVSRHLGMLKEAGLVAEERDGGFSYYRAAARAGADQPLTAILQAQFEASASDPAVRADEARLQEVLRLRKENFDAHAGPDTRDAPELAPGHATFEGSHAQVRDAINEPKGIQDHIPLIVGGNGRERTASLAVRFADELNFVYLGTDEVRVRMSELRARRAG